MKRLAALLGIPAAIAAVAALAIVPSAAEEVPPPIGVEFLTDRAEFTDDVSVQIRVKLDGQRTRVLNARDASRLVTAEITIQPGVQFPWHTHPGPVLINVAEGTFTYVNAHDCVPRVYEKGEALIDPGYGNVHTAYNDTNSVIVVIATFLDAPEEGPLTIPADGPEDNCGIDVATHAHH